MGPIYTMNLTFLYIFPTQKFVSSLSYIIGDRYNFVTNINVEWLIINSKFLG